jgi:hypothetical protein
MARLVDKAAKEREIINLKGVRILIGFGAKP